MAHLDDIIMNPCTWVAPMVVVSCERSYTSTWKEKTHVTILLVPLSGVDVTNITDIDTGSEICSSNSSRTDCNFTEEDCEICRKSTLNILMASFFQYCAIYSIIHLVHIFHTRLFHSSCTVVLDNKCYNI